MESTSFASSEVLPTERTDPDFADHLNVPDAAVKKVVFCCGKVYYDLLNHREAAGADKVALVRVEQLVRIFCPCFETLEPIPVC
jgi:2-oxoglutarate dehydrogenase complex dehydrogenase (E1) component-like enzyme